MRAYAALSVLVVHTRQNFGEIRTQPAANKVLDLLVLDAQIGVNFFLVLSGFLITYLLLTEQDQTGSIDAPRFYVRRILRIWPLYYLIVFLGLVVLPLVLGSEYALNKFPFSKTIAVLVLLPNFVGSLGPLEHLWSIGLEQQFYLIWPWVVHSKKRLIQFSLGILLVKLAILPVITKIGVGSVQSLFLSLRFESLAIGALGAYLYFSNHKILPYVYSPAGQITGITGVVLLAIFDVPLTYLGHLFTSFIFIIFTLNTATNPQPWVKFENRIIDQLGIISYGIYMFHYPILYLTIITLNSTKLPEGNLYSFLLYSITISLTIMLSLISYYGFEIRFLRLKENYSVVKTQQ